MSVVCSTWDLPCVCPPLLGLHTMAAGVRCAAGTHDSTFSTVCIVDSRSRTVLPDGSIGNVWVAMAAEHLPSARGPGIAPLQWTFHPDTRTRQGPFRVSGAPPLLQSPTDQDLGLSGFLLRNDWPCFWTAALAMYGWRWQQSTWRTRTWRRFASVVV